MPRPKIPFELNVAEKNDARALSRVACDFLYYDKSGENEGYQDERGKTCSRTSSSEFMLIFTPPSIATALKYDWEPGG